MRNTPSIAALMKLVTVYSVLGVPYLTLMPVIARDQLGLDAGGYGALLACVGVGGVTGALSLAAIGDRVRGTRLLSAAAYAYGGLLIGLALARDAAVAYPVLLATGFMMIVNNAYGEFHAPTPRPERAARPDHGGVLVRRRRPVYGHRLVDLREHRAPARRIVGDRRRSGGDAGLRVLGVRAPPGVARDRVV
jgi:hypothetical protein